MPHTDFAKTDRDTDGLAQAARNFNLFAVPEDYFDNPYPYFRLLRNHDPIHANPDGSLLLTRYEDVRRVWRDPAGLVNKAEMFRQKFGEGPLLEHHTSTVLFKDNPDHDRLRATINPFFTHARVKEHQAFVEEFVETLLDEVEDLGSFDILHDFANKLPIAVICRVLGVPQEDGAYIQELGRRILFALNPAVSADDIAAGHDAAARFKSFILDIVHDAERKPDLDPTATLVNALVHASRSGSSITENEIAHMCILTLNGGYETTTNLIAGSINALLDFPDQLDLMRNGTVGPQVSPMAFEELTRFVTPLQLQGRRTTADIEISTGTIPAGTEVVVSQASANRDERMFANPEFLNLTRTPNAHLAFGVGMHACAGRPLAKLEAEIAVPAFVRRFRKIEKTGPVIYNRNVRFRGIQFFPALVS